MTKPDRAAHVRAGTKQQRQRSGRAVSATPGRRPRRAKVGRAAIARAARDVFTQQGYDATTFQEISERAGVARPTVNYHFATKRNLYNEVIRSTTDVLLGEALRRGLAASTLAEQVSVFIEALTLAGADERAAARFMVSSQFDLRRHPALQDIDPDAVAAVRAFLTSVVAGAIRRGEVRSEIDTVAVVDMLLAVMWGVVLYASVVDGDRDLSVITDQIRRLLRGGAAGMPPTRLPIG